MPENVQSFHGPLSERVRALAIAHCAGRRGRLLDVGCGNGLLFDALTPHTDLQCYGADRSVELLGEVRHRCAGRVRAVNGMIDRLPFRDRVFDVVACLNTLLNLPTLAVVEVAFGEMMRISADEVIVDIRNAANPYIRFKYWRHRQTADFPTVAYRLEDIKRIFRANGFSLAAVYPVGINSRPLAWGFVMVGKRAVR